MKKYFDQLRPLERRLVIGVAVVLFIVVNWVFVWPYHSAWNDLGTRLNTATTMLKDYRANVAQKPELEKSVKVYESDGEYVQPQDQAINFMRSIQQQASSSGFGIQQYSRSMMNTNQFFVNQIQNITVSATEPQLVDFLYKIGTSAAMIRVRDLELQPDQPRQRLNANVKLVASYQKNPKAPAAAVPAARAATNSTVKAP